MESRDKIVVKLPCKPEYVSVARLTVSGVASRIGFDIDTVEDIKVAVSEVCSRIISVAGSSEKQYEIWFDISAKKLTISFSAKIERINCIFEDDEDGLGAAIINAFMDEVEYCPEGKDYILSMTKNFEVISCNGL
ncbi:MAG: anti-sigma regulatory factor [Clostridiaceae bacterium]|jgi:serine/threonine-protein kinase RsbW|nr:anti-sigma regulatory factor [Clostridiaceae bacterium]